MTKKSIVLVLLLVVGCVQAATKTLDELIAARVNISKNINADLEALEMQAATFAEQKQTDEARFDAARERYYESLRRWVFVAPSLANFVVQLENLQSNQKRFNEKTNELISKVFQSNATGIDLSGDHLKNLKAAALAAASPQATVIEKWKLIYHFFDDFISDPTTRSFRLMTWKTSCCWQKERE